MPGSNLPTEISTDITGIDFYKEAERDKAYLEQAERSGKVKVRAQPLDALEEINKRKNPNAAQNGQSFMQHDKIKKSRKMHKILSRGFNGKSFNRNIHNIAMSEDDFERMAKQEELQYQMQMKKRLGLDNSPKLSRN